MSSALLARHADCLFWLARYIERAENLARILDVNETFSRDRGGAQDWRPILELYADQTRFFERHPESNAAAVLEFFVTDRSNPTSIAANIQRARENARQLRPLISTEMWTQINMFHNRMAGLPGAALASGNRARLFAEIKEACQTHTGITEGTFYRDEGWYMYQLGRGIERADQTTRLIDVKCNLLMQQSDIGSPVDLNQWNTLLRSAAAYHAFRRTHAGGAPTARGVAGFLLFDRRFPRSVYHCIDDADQTLHTLKRRFGLRGGDDAAEELDRMRVHLETARADEILHGGLHEYLDFIQNQLIGVANAISAAFFGRRETRAAPTQNQTQTQKQTSGADAPDQDL